MTDQNKRVTIYVDTPDHPSNKIDSEPAWSAELVHGPPGDSHTIYATSIAGPAAAVAFCLSIYGRRKEKL